MRNQVSSKLLATVAASAASVTSVGVVAAHAADAQVTDPAVVDSRIKIAFEGAVYQSNVDKLGDTSDKLGSGNDFGDLYGSVALTKAISSDVDWRLAGTFHAGQDNDFSLNVPQSGGVIGLSFGNSYNFQTLDFDIGKHVEAQGADIRFFGGLRLLHSKEKLNFNVSATPNDPADKGGNADKLGSSEFYGIGPRLGAEVYYPLGETWGLTGAVSGSAMWGRRTDKFSLHEHESDPSDPTPDPDINVSESQHSNKVVTSIDLSGGVTLKPWENTTFTAGYRVEQWHNLLEMADKSTQTFNGPFLRLEVKM
ncbi:Lpg1974 family pore-forming outer membrane protein [Mesorhizobium sp. M0676]|uniref:Lpg1974 family pore-forming outer membrane protein n=1 Tax=Mesorhizobium sp. M0676 TaxID=2956984 RepID=UPI003337D6AE